MAVTYLKVLTHNYSGREGGGMKTCKNPKRSVVGLQADIRTRDLPQTNKGYRPLHQVQKYPAN